MQQVGHPCSGEIWAGLGGSSTVGRGRRMGGREEAADNNKRRKVLKKICEVEVVKKTMREGR